MIGAQATRFTPDLVAELDEPVRRYFTHAIREGAPLADRFRLTMAGRIKVGRLWLPFTATQKSERDSFVWAARVGIGPLTVITVTDQYVDGAGLMQGLLFGRRTMFHVDDEATTRSAAGRTALEACVLVPASLLPASGVQWRAESDEHIVASWQLGPERPDVEIRIAPDGGIRAVSLERWGRVGTPGFHYIRCGADIHAEQRFGDFTVPSRMSVSWWHGTAHTTPFFVARLREYAPIPMPEEIR